MSDFSEKVLGLPGKETLFPARLRSQETFWETMFPRLWGP